MKSIPIPIQTLDKFILLIANKKNKSEWYELPKRTRDVFYSQDVSKWLNKSSLHEKMFFLEDLGYTIAMAVFPNGNFGISHLEELSGYFFKVEDRIKAVEKALEKNLFTITTREMGTIFYNMAQSSNGKYYQIKQDVLLREQVNENFKNETFKSATEYSKNKDTREAILKFVNNILVDFNGQTGELGLQSITILSFLRANSEVGMRTDSIKQLFKGSIGDRMTYKYLQMLTKKGYINKTGKKDSTLYLLSAKGMLYIQDYIERIFNL